MLLTISQLLKPGNRWSIRPSDSIPATEMRIARKNPWIWDLRQKWQAAKNAMGMSAGGLIIFAINARPMLAMMRLAQMNVRR